MSTAYTEAAAEIIAAYEKARLERDGAGASHPSTSYLAG